MIKIKICRICCCMYYMNEPYKCPAHNHSSPYACSSGPCSCSSGPSSCVPTNSTSIDRRGAIWDFPVIAAS